VYSDLHKSERETSVDSGKARAITATMSCKLVQLIVCYSLIIVCVYLSLLCNAVFMKVYSDFQKSERTTSVDSKRGSSNYSYDQWLKCNLRGGETVLLCLFINWRWGNGVPFVSYHTLTTSYDA